MIPASVLEQMQAEMGEQQIPLPDFPMRPPGVDFEHPVPKEEDKAPESQTHLEKGATVDTLKRAKEEGISLGDQKKARKAARKLVSLSREKPQEEWMGLYMGIIGETPELYPYIKAVSVYAALAEAQSDEETANRIVAALKEPGVVPATLPYTEEEWVSQKGGSDNEV